MFRCLMRHSRKISQWRKILASSLSHTPPTPTSLRVNGPVYFSCKTTILPNCSLLSLYIIFIANPLTHPWINVMVSSWGPYGALSVPPTYIYRQSRFCNTALWCHCLSQKLSVVSEHISNTLLGLMLKVCPGSSSESVPSEWNYTFPNSDLRFG